jgi:hypothetical protein
MASLLQRRLAQGLVCLSMVLAGCAHASPAALRQARVTLCGHLLSSYPGAFYVQPGPASTFNVAEFESELRSDAALFAKAGDTSTAHLVSTFADEEQRYFQALTTTTHVAVFLVGSASISDVQALQAMLSSDQDIVGLRYESKEDAYGRFVALYRDQPALIAAVSSDALPASFRVTLKSADGLTALQDLLRGVRAVDTVEKDSTALLDPAFVTEYATTAKAVLNLCGSSPSPGASPSHS